MFALNSHVFYVLAWGYAGDHFFSWFSKALNAHPEIFALMAHEGSRPKYIKERSRSERPDLVSFTAFLEDMGMTYQAIGDCWSYRPWHFKQVTEDSSFNSPLLFLSRHPYIWLEYYIRWRSTNMRMPDGSSDALDHEWKISQHEYFRELDLFPYEKKDVAIWGAYQGMYQLNKHRKDIHSSIRCESIESIIENKERFSNAVSYLTKGRVLYSPQLIDEVYHWISTPFRGEDILNIEANHLYQSWPDWKKEAFEKIVEVETLEFYKKIGQYEY